MNASKTSLVYVGLKDYVRVITEKIRTHELATAVTRKFPWWTLLMESNFQEIH